MLRYLLIALTLTFLVSCATKVPEGKTPAETLYREAEEHLKHNRKELAIEKLNTIKSQHPYSFYAVQADLMLADILFLQENFIESAAAYLSFKELHPKYEKMDYVLWRIGESYYQQLPSTHDRDLSASKEAILYLTELITRFPQSEHSTLAKERLDKIQVMLREQDLYIAHFYYKTDTYFSARHRYFDIIEKYQAIPEIRDLGMVRIVECSYELKEYEACIRYADDYLNQVSEKEKKRVKVLQEKCEKGLKEKPNDGTT